MDEVSVIGIDLAKSVFELCAVSAVGETLWTRRLKRAAFIRFMEERAPRCLVGLEACGGSHHWGRWLEARGFAVKLMGPRQVKAYRAGPHKSDARDAAAVAEAASRPAVKAIRVKSEAAQAVQALARVRARRTRQLTATSNQLRGLLAEFGLIAPKGRGALLKAVAAFKEAGALPEPVRVLIEELAAEVLAQARALVEADKALARRVGEDEAALRLMSIPFIGPVNAAGLSVALTAPGDFKDGRAFAACQGLAPRQDQSGERDRKTGIPRQCANDTRANLVCAAQALLTAVGRMEREPEDPFLAWARALKARKPRNVAAVAVAAKLARIAWSVAAGGAPYAPRRTQAQLEAARPAA